MSEELKDLYGKVWEEVFSLTMDGHSGLEIAAVLAAQAMTIYKTILSDAEYEDIALAIYNARQDVRKIELPNVTIQ